MTVQIYARFLSAASKEVVSVDNLQYHQIKSEIEQKKWHRNLFDTIQQQSLKIMQDKYNGFLQSSFGADYVDQCIKRAKKS